MRGGNVERQNEGAGEMVGRGAVLCVGREAVDKEAGAAEKPVARKIADEVAKHEG